MKPVLPRRVKVRQHYYKVVMVAERIRHGDVWARGTCDPVNRIIRVWSGQTRRWVISTFMHEVLHAFEFEYRIKLSHQTIFDLEMPLAQLMLQNPALRRHVRFWRLPLRARRTEPADSRRRRARSAPRSRTLRACGKKQGKRSPSR